jgi:hypothetical protein
MTDGLQVPANVHRVSRQAARGDLHRAAPWTMSPLSARCGGAPNLSPTRPRCAAAAAWVPPSSLPGGGAGYPVPSVRLTLLPSAKLQQVLMLAASRGLRRAGGRS